MHPDPVIELPKLEREWMNAWIVQDRAVCDRILDDEFLLSSALGRLMSKPEWLAGATGQFKCESFDWQEILVRSFGEFAIVHSKTRQKASVGGKDWSGVFMLTDVWIVRGSDWKVVTRQGTGPLPETTDVNP